MALKREVSLSARRGHDDYAKWQVAKSATSLRPIWRKIAGIRECVGWARWSFDLRYKQWLFAVILRTP